MQRTTVSPPFAVNSSNTCGTVSPATSVSLLPERWSGESLRQRVEHLTSLHQKLLLDDVPQPTAAPREGHASFANSADGGGDACAPKRSPPALTGNRPSQRSAIPSPPSLSGSPTRQSESGSPTAVSCGARPSLTQASLARVSIKGRAEGSSTKLSPLEKEFHSAVEELYLEVGGVNYRRIAHESVTALEAVLRIFREGVAIAKATGPVVPQAEVARQRDAIAALVAEARAFAGENGSELAARAGATRDEEPKKGDPREIYDIGVLMPGYGGHSESAAFEDEIQHLKGRLQALVLERNNLQQTVDQQDRQLQSMRSKVLKECETFSKQRAALMEKLELVQSRLGLEPLRAQGTSPADITPEQSWLPSRGERTPRSIVVATSHSGEYSQSAPPSPSAAIASAKAAVTGDANTSAVSTNSVPGIAARYNKLEAVYSEVYQGKGMEFLRSCVDCVFKREYDEGNDKTFEPNGGYAMFKEDFRHAITRIIESEADFRESICNATPLRAEYVANCLSSHIKPNSGVVKLLSAISNDRDVESFSLRGLYVGDQGIQPLVPILTRLYRLRELNVSDNGLKNNSVHALVQTLSRHTALTSINLSNNNISRAGGKDVLNLLGACPKLQHVDVSGNDIDKVLSERITSRALINAANNSADKA